MIEMKHEYMKESKKIVCTLEFTAQNSFLNHLFLILDYLNNRIHIPHKVPLTANLKDHRFSINQVSGKRVGIVGLGSIGSRVAKRFSAFSCSIAYTSTKIKPNVPYTYHANVADLASASDVLVVCCALTNQTRHLINGDVMAALGSSGIIVNVGRGALVDEEALVRMLVRGEIGGAGLDVFQHEPRVPEELFGLDNVVLSPHHAVLTPDSLQALEDLVFGNIEAFFSNQPLRAEVE